MYKDVTGRPGPARAAAAKCSKGARRIQVLLLSLFCSVLSIAPIDLFLTLRRGDTPSQAHTPGSWLCREASPPALAWTPCC